MTIKKQTKKYGSKHNSSKKYTKRVKPRLIGGNDPQECGVDDEGNRLPDCPEGFRCKKHKKNKRGVCITSQLVVTYQDNEIVLNAPEKRHNKWNMELIQSKIDEFSEIRNNSLKYTRNEIDEMIKGLIDQLVDNTLVSQTNGATTRDEKIIRYIMLKNVLETENQSELPNEIQEQIEETQNDSETKEENKEKKETDERPSNQEQSGIFSFLSSNKQSKTLEALDSKQIEKID